jgi:hypothetical protein
LNADEVTAPVQIPVRLCGIEEAGTLRWIIVAGVTVIKPVGHDLIDDLFLEVLGVGKRWNERKQACGSERKANPTLHGVSPS